MTYEIGLTGEKLHRLREVQQTLERIRSEFDNLTIICDEVHENLCLLMDEDSDKYDWDLQKIDADKDSLENASKNITDAIDNLDFVING